MLEQMINIVHSKHLWVIFFPWAYILTRNQTWTLHYLSKYFRCHLPSCVFRNVLPQSSQQIRYSTLMCFSSLLCFVL